MKVGSDGGDDNDGAHVSGLEKPALHMGVEEISPTWFGSPGLGLRSQAASRTLELSLLLWTQCAAGRDWNRWYHEAGCLQCDLQDFPSALCLSFPTDVAIRQWVLSVTQGRCHCPWPPQGGAEGQWWRCGVKPDPTVQGPFCTVRRLFKPL